MILHSDEPIAEYVQHRGVKETEAESVALTAGMAGLDTSAYSVGYVAGWSKGDVSVIRAAAENVMRAVHTLADVVEESDGSALRGANPASETPTAPQLSPATQGRHGGVRPPNKRVAIGPVAPG